MKYIYLFENYDYFNVTPEELESLFKREMQKDVPDVEKIKTIIDHPDFDYFLNNELSGRGLTPLMLAIRNNLIDVVRYLLNRNGITINTRNNDGYTALMLASMLGRTEIVKILLSNSNIKINMQNKGGYTALMLASAGGHTEIVRLFLERPEIDINIKNNSGSSAFFNARPEIREQFPELNPNAL